MAEQETSNAILTSCDVTTRRKEGRKEGREGGGGESKEGRKEGKRKEWKEREMDDWMDNIILPILPSGDSST